MTPAPIDSEDRVKQVRVYIASLPNDYTKKLLSAALDEIERLRKLFPKVKP